MIEVSGPLLRGDCNRCGLCCVVYQDGVPYVCDYLIKMDHVGQPSATLCLKYETRTHHMPITLTSADDRTIGGKCAADGTPEETAAIIAKGIGRGCSLEIVA